MRIMWIDKVEHTILSSISLLIPLLGLMVMTQIYIILIKNVLMLIAKLFTIIIFKFIFIKFLTKLGVSNHHFILLLFYRRVRREGGRQSRVRGFRLLIFNDPWRHFIFRASTKWVKNKNKKMICNCCCAATIIANYFITLILFIFIKFIFIKFLTKLMMKAIE
jgi:hypothetical protein